MAQYEKVFTKPYEDGYVDLPNQTTPITAETLNDKDTAIEHIENYLHDNDANGNLADDYDSTATYSIGDYAVYEGVLYRCITAVSTAEDFDDDKWTAVSVGDELELKANATDIPTALSELTGDSTHRLVTDEEIAEWDAKVGADSYDEKTVVSGQFETMSGGKLESCIVAFNPVQSGSGDPSPSNVRPITGHTQVEVTNVGKNKLPMTVSRIKSVNTSGTWSGNVYTKNSASIEIQTDNANNVIGFKISGTPSQNIDFYIFGVYGSTTVAITSGEYKANLTGIVNGIELHSGYANGGFDTVTFANQERTLNAINGVSYAMIRVLSGASLSTPIVVSPMIRLSTVSDATYEPYQRQDIIVNLGGTYYGGKHDVVSGVMTIDTKYGTLPTTGWNGNSGWNPSAFAHSTPFNDIKPTSGYGQLADMICDTVKIETPARIAATSATNVGIGVETKNFYINLGDEINTTEKLTQYLTNNPIHVAYKLETNVVIQFTPQQINTLIGENNIDVPMTGQSLTSAVYRELFAWSDVEDVVELRLPISAIGTDESNNDNASQAYSQGDYFYKNGIAKAKTSIASGATFTLGTNYEIKTLADILKALES